MKVYFLEWDNCLDYEDNSVTLLGIYSSDEKRQKAKSRYLSGDLKRWPFSTYNPNVLNGKFIETIIDIDIDLYPDLYP